MGITITLEATRLKCTECDHVYKDEEPGEVRANAEPVYECGNCGEQFTKEDSPAGNHQCPGCNKFASKMDAIHPEWLFLTGAKADVDRITRKMGAFSVDPKEHFTGMYVGNLRTDRWRKVRPDAPPAVIAATLREIALPPEKAAAR